MKRNSFSIRGIILIFLLCSFSSSIMAQKANLDTLNIDQLNLYKDKAELTLQKFNIASKNSMAMGLGITIRF